MVVGQQENVGANNLPVSKTEDEKAVPDFVQAMYDEMGELTEMYGLCYEMVKEPSFEYSTEAYSKWCFEIESLELDHIPNHESNVEHEIIFWNYKGEQKHSYEADIRGPIGKMRYTEEMQNDWIEIITALAVANDPTAKFEEVKTKVTEIVMTQDPDEDSSILELGDYQLTIESYKSDYIVVQGVYKEEL